MDVTGDGSATYLYVGHPHRHRKNCDDKKTPHTSTEATTSVETMKKKEQFSSSLRMYRQRQRPLRQYIPNSTLGSHLLLPWTVALIALMSLIERSVIFTTGYTLLDPATRHSSNRHRLSSGRSRGQCLIHDRLSQSQGNKISELQLATSSSDLKKSGQKTEKKTAKTTTSKTLQNKVQSTISSSSTKPSKPSASLQKLVPKKKNKASSTKRRQVTTRPKLQQDSISYDNDDEDDYDDVDEEELERQEAARLDLQQRKTVVTRLARAAREAAKARREKEEQEAEMRRIEDELQQLEKEEKMEVVKAESYEEDDIIVEEEDSMVNEKESSPSLSSLRNTLKNKNKRRRYKSQDHSINTGVNTIINNINLDDYDEIPSISSLNDVIENELLHPADGSSRPPRETESMRALLEHNILYDDIDSKDILGMDMALIGDIINENDGDDDTNINDRSNFDQEEGNKNFSDERHDERKTDKKNKGKTDRKIAVVFARPLVDGQISMEYASRLASLARSIESDSYRPDLVYFCGSLSPKRNFDVVPEGAAGIVYFRHLCAANNISLDGIDLVWTHGPKSSRKTSSKSTATTTDDDVYGDEAFGILGGLTSTPPPMDDEDLPPLRYNPWSQSSLKPIVNELLGSGYLNQWLAESELFESETDEYGLTREMPRKKISLHWTLISTDYDLAALNNIHLRSPRQSPLETLRLLQQRISKQYRGICVSTWSFKYSVYPFVYSTDDILAAFLGKCYLLAQDVLPVLVNIWGVAGNVSERRKLGWYICLLIALLLTIFAAILGYSLNFSKRTTILHWLLLVEPSPL